MGEVQVLLPKADPNMSEGRIVEWLKMEGERVEAGDVLATVETEKLEFPVEAPAGGLLRKIIAKVGDTVEVARSIAIIDEG